MANDVYELVITAKSAGQMVQNVFHFRSELSNTIDPGGIANELVEAYVTTRLTPWLTILPENYFTSSLRARRINNGGGNSATASSGGSPGTIPGPASDALAGVQIHWPFTDSAGYYGTGKTFCPGISPGNVVDGQLQAGLLALVSTWINTNTTTLSAPSGDFDFTIWSPTKNADFLPFGGGASIKLGFISRRLKPVF